MTWKTIDSAPRDGTRVLVCGLSYGEGPHMWITVGFTADGIKWFESPNEYPELHSPTHWMPLPLPPQPPESHEAGE